MDVTSLVENGVGGQTMTDRDRLIELIRRAKTEVVCCTSDGEPVTKWQRNIVDRAEANDLADHLLANGVIAPPCKVGDYVLWNNGLKDSKTKLIEVKGFYYNSNDFGLRYILVIGQPIISHSGIVGIVPKEEAEEKLKELGQ